MPGTLDEPRPRRFSHVMRGRPPSSPLETEEVVEINWACAGLGGGGRDFVGSRIHGHGVAGRLRTSHPCVLHVSAASFNFHRARPGTEGLVCVCNTVSDISLCFFTLFRPPWREATCRRQLRVPRVARCPYVRPQPAISWGSDSGGRVHGVSPGRM